MRKDYHWRFTRCKIDWILYFITHGLLCQYILSSGEDLLRTQLPNQAISAWNGMFVCLSNGFILPFHYWGFLLWILTRSSTVWVIHEAVLRFPKRTVWLRKTTCDAFKSAASLAVMNILSTILWCLLRYGIPSSSIWEATALVPISTWCALWIILFARIFVSLAVTVFFILLILHIRKKALAAGIVLLVLLLADWILLETPPYLSLKPIVFTASFSFVYFGTGAMVSNLILSYGTSLIVSLVLYYLCMVRLQRKECILQ